MPSKLKAGQLVEVQASSEALSVPSEWRKPGADAVLQVGGQRGQLTEFDEETGTWTVATFSADMVSAKEDLLRPLATDDVKDFDLALGPASSSVVMGQELTDGLARKGHVLCKLFIAPEDLSGMVTTADRAVEEGAFSRLATELEPGYLGRDGTGKTLSVDMEADDTAEYVKDSPIKIVEDAISTVGLLLRPHCEVEFGFDIYSRSNSILALPFDGDEDAFPSPDLENEDAASFLSMMWRAKLQVVVNAGPATAQMTMLPKLDGDAETTLTVQPGMMAIFATDRYRFSYEPEGKALMIASWFLDQPKDYVISDVQGDLSYLSSASSGPSEPNVKKIPVTSLAERYAFGVDEPWKLWTAYSKAGWDTGIKHPFARWDIDIYYSPDADQTSGLSYTCHGGFSDGIELFDCRFFDISPAEAKGMDPTQRQVLEVSYMALSGAGWSKKQLQMKPANIAVFVGLDKNEWNSIPKDIAGGFGASSSANAITSNRFNYCMNLKGASMTIDTACSASLVCTHTGKLYLMHNEYDACEAVVICGVNLSISPFTYVGGCGAGMHSHIGRCFTYNFSADGYMRGEATAAVSIKLKNFEPDNGDYALMAGSQVNQDGRSASLTAPNGPSQERCNRAVIKEVKIKPREIDTTECHGTGTQGRQAGRQARWLAAQMIHADPLPSRVMLADHPPCLTWAQISQTSLQRDSSLGAQHSLTLLKTVGRHVQRAGAQLRVNRLPVSPLHGSPCLAGALAMSLAVAARTARRRGRPAGEAGRCKRARMSAIPLDPDEKVVGIDLGTTNSIIATFEAGEPLVVPNAEGERCTPSVVAFDKDGEVLVGQVARRQAVLNPLNTYQSVKRFIGRQYNEVEGEIGAFPYKVLDVNGQVRLDCPALGRQLKPEEISAHVLRKLKADVEGRLNCKVKKAVISVPAYFNDTQRQATKTAGKMAGLEVLRIVNEPTMAALAYGLDQRNLSTLLVLDLGGGTFDVSVLEVGDGVIEVMAVNGDTNLGGNDLDQLIVDLVLQAFKTKEGIDLREDPQAFARVKEACENAKIELSELKETRISIPFIAMSDEGPLHVDEVLTQDQFTEMCVDTIVRTGDPIFQCLKDGEYRMKDVTQVVHVGGATRVPGVQAFWADITNYQNVNNSINPEEVVAVGAAVHAAMVVGETKDIILIDVTPLTLGVETNGGVFTPVIERNTAIPTKGTRLFTTSEDAQDSIEVVVLQGERPMAADNKALESFRLEGIPPAPAGIPKIEVTFEIDRDGILAVSAKDWATRREHKVVLSDTQNVEENVVQETVQEAEDMWDADEDQKEKLELLFSAKTLVNKTRENMADLGSKIPEDAKGSLMPRLELLETAVVKAVAAEEEGERIEYEELNMLTQDLRFELMKLGPRVWGKQIAPDNMPGPAKARPPGGAASGGIADNAMDYVDAA